MKLYRALAYSAICLAVMGCSKEDDDSPSGGSGSTSECFELKPYTEQLPNFSFDEWGNKSTPEGTLEEPCGAVWVSPNQITQQLGSVDNTIKSTDAQDGTYALRMETVDIQVIPGLIAPVFGGLFTGQITGKFDILDPNKNIERGVPYTAKPSSFSGLYKYLPMNGDSAFIDIELRKYDPVNKQRISIGTGSLTIRSTVSTYTAFDINIDYTLPNETPDSIRIEFYSSKVPEDALTGQAGSTLYIDNCKLNF